MKIRNLLIGVVLAAICATSLTACSSSKADNPASGTSTSESSTASETENNAEKDLSGNIGEVRIAPGDLVAEIEIEGYGTMKAKLFPDIAPIGVENFKQLAEKGYYDGKNIHRVISDFMMQGGSENGDGTGGEPAYTGEGSTASYFGTEINRNARHVYGALCYANAAGRNSTQFYIVNNKVSQDISDLDITQAEKNVETAKAYKEQYTAGSDEYNYYEYLEKEYGAVVDWFKSPTHEEVVKYKDGGVFYLDGGYTVFGQVVEGFDVIDNIAAVEVQENSNGEKSQPVSDIIIKSVKVYTAE